MENSPNGKAKEKGAKVVLDLDAPRLVPLWICVSGFESLPPSQYFQCDNSWEPLQLVKNATDLLRADGLILSQQFVLGVFCWDL
jgi:hypothetical protein